MKRHFLIFGATKGTGKCLLEYLEKNKNYNITTFGRSKNTFQSRNINYFSQDITNYKKLYLNLNKSVVKFGKFNTIIFMQRHRSINDKNEIEKDIEVGVIATQKIIDYLVNNLFFNENDYNNSITLVSSIADHYISTEQKIGYHVSKAALNQLGRFYAAELGKIGIRVNTISPCVVKKKEAVEFYKKNQTLVNKFNNIIPIGRMGVSKDIINLIIFLSSNKASYITGQNIVIDGGLTLLSHESLIRGALKNKKDD